MSEKTKPAVNAIAVTPSDTVDIAGVGFTVTRGLFVGVAGVVVAIINGQAVTFTGVQNGQILPIQCTRVNSTNTTATDMVALW
jgi:hypothetical protein